MSIPVAVLPTNDAEMRRLFESADQSREPAADMADLAEVMRALLGVASSEDTPVRLGGNLFDVVITSAGIRGRAVIALMDEIPGGCGPVVEDPEAGWLYWLVPPGSAIHWAPHGHAVCLTTPFKIRLPSLTRHSPPGPYWARPSASDRLVPVGPLRTALAQLRPEPAPHAPLYAQLTGGT
ncbi:hypothetical protein ABZ682_19395 [Streptomyces griseoviridis]|uniref:hypothetical protein n=1 Tax=Streptomyces griseoviridis TaxID=45398 RepID=UPI00340143F5